MTFPRIFYLLILLLCPAIGLAADQCDQDGFPLMYVRGTMTGNWAVNEDFRMIRSGDCYTISLKSLDGEFKVSGTGWEYNYGAQGYKLEVDRAMTVDAIPNGANFIASGLTDVTISFHLVRGNDGKLQNSIISISANGNDAPDSPSLLSGTLPVMYINVYAADGNTFDDEIIDRNLSHKNYFDAEYWLDLNGCQWMADEGAKSIGSKESPLPLEIKARGNFTRTSYSKKPFKIKLGSKQALLGLSKNKHFALLAHADDNCGYLRNFTGFNLGRRIGLPWTPWQQPVELVINGDYRGLYFLTESIRIDSDRVDITELDDLADNPAIISGGYLVELDNYDEEDNQIRMQEQSCVSGHWLDMLRITFDTPEEYSDIQRKFVSDQFAAMNDYVGANSDNLWSYLDLDDAARYYIVEEIISHTEAYHGSTYLFRDRGEGQKWHFSPLWDCGNAFNGREDAFFYNCDPFGNTWIPSFRANEAFNTKVEETWKWFMSACYDGIINDIDIYTGHIAEAAKADRARWKNEPAPDGDLPAQVADNSNMQARRDKVVNHLEAKTRWLADQLGDYTSGQYPEPARDTTPAAPLPSYATTGIAPSPALSGNTPELYNLQGIRVSSPRSGELYIVRQGTDVSKRIIK